LSSSGSTAASSVTPLTRAHDLYDERRELAVEELLRHVRAQYGVATADMYRIDIEHLGEAVLAFAEDWASERG
jgi:hypothetical protein